MGQPVLPFPRTMKALGGDSVTFLQQDVTGNLASPGRDPTPPNR
jgi:hypothetical protein